jgi:uncharacterized protein
MKYLLVLVVVLVGFWSWRNRRVDDDQNPPAAPKQRPGPSALPQTMVRCNHCGLHLPLQEALKGRKGQYCSVQHRQLLEG